MKLETALAAIVLFATPSVAQPTVTQPSVTKPSVAQTSSTYIALAVADGPTANQRLVLAFRGSDPTSLINLAVGACYRRAASGCLHTCKVSYGDAWVVATACELSPTDIKFGIGDDQNSPEAARQKAIEAICKTEHIDVASCRVIASYSASDMKTARSVATDDEPD